MAPADLEGLDPGIARTVAWLRTHGFETTDSGDGKTKLADGYEGALDFPHVFMAVAPERMVAEAHRLWSLVREAPGAHVETSYDPENAIAVLMLTHVDDDALVTVHAES